jgi:peptidoglycan-N-acetylglucosamine deacetylase
MKGTQPRRVVLGTALVAIAQLGPLLTGVDWLRAAALPRLAGLGRHNHIALTFDDGPDPSSTPAVLDALDNFGWSATFFMTGQMVQRWPAVARAVANRGHEIGVHGYAHRSHAVRLPAAVAGDIARAVAIIEDTTGIRPLWFRPPYGFLSPATLVAARRHGLRLVLWSASGRDWLAEANGKTVGAEIEASLRPGATLLLHDSDCVSAPGSWRAMIAALPVLQQRAAREGWEVGPLGDHWTGEGGSTRRSSRRGG